MFRFAQWVVRHKVLVVAVGAAGFIFFGGEKETPQPSNPWSAGTAPQVAEGSSSSKKSMASKAFGVVKGAAKDYAGVDLGGGVSAGALQEKTTDSWKSADAALKKANEQ